MSYGKRLKKIRKELGLTQSEIAQVIGLKNKQTISDIETGKQQRLSAKHELTFCKKYDIDILWLQIGDENNYKHLSDSQYVEEPQGTYAQNISLIYYPNKYTTSEYGCFSSFQNKKVITFHKSFIELYLGLTSYQDIFVVDSIGESMEPTLPENAFLFINPIENERTIRDGSIYMIACDEVTLVKRVYHNPIDDMYTLISDHIRHDDIKISNFKESGCKFIGRVVGNFNKL